MKKALIALILIFTILFTAGCQGAPSPINPCTPNVADGHTDTDSNGICDGCGISVVVCIDFYAINDLHGKFADTDSQPGVDELTTYLKSKHASDDNVVILSSGDMWQGSSESNLTKGRIITEGMNDLDFASMTLGNHEFDWGEDYIEQNLELAEFPFLAINVFDKETNRRADYCAPSIMVERGGIQIGIIGAIGDCYSSISGDKVEDVYFKVDKELTELVKKESDRLRTEGADFIVYSLHDGYEKSQSGTGTITQNKLSSYYDPSLSDGYVDLVFEGHTHQSYVLKDSAGVYHLQNGGDNDGISHTEVMINFANGTSFVSEAEFIETDEYSRLEDDKIVENLLDKYEDTIANGNRVLGRCSSYLNSTELRRIVAELYYRCGVELWGDEYDITLGGGYLNVRSPYHLDAGEVTYSDLLMLFPFDNQITLCSISGYYLKKRFIETGNDNYFIYPRDLSGEDINPGATYYIIVDSYTSDYAPNHLRVIKTYDANVFARDLLAEYIESGGLG